MRRLALVLLAACGGGADDPRCVDALTKLAKRVGADPEMPQVHLMIGRCEQMKWPRSVRACVSDAATAQAAVECAKPVFVADEKQAAAGDAKVLGDAPKPGESTKKIVETAKGLEVLWFGGEKQTAVGEHVEAYFKALGVKVRRVDRIADAEAAKKYRVGFDGALVLTRIGPDGDRWEKLEVGDEAKRAARKLANFDREVNAALLKLVREKRAFYITTGHGEITDGGGTPERKTTTLERNAEMLNFKVGKLGEFGATEIPADATVVAILGPTKAFTPAEQAVLGRYLDRGGALLLAYEPDGIASLGDALDKKLGTKRDTGHLTDDKSFLPQRNTPADRRIVITNKFSAHPAASSVARAVNKGMVFLGGSSLLAIETPAKKTVIVKSLDSSFLDRDDDFTRDDNEELGPYDLAVAVEDKYRALVFADADIFADALVNSTGRPQVVMIGGPIFNDGMRWLAREDAFVGEIVDEPVTPDKKQPEEDTRGRDIMRAFADVLTAKPVNRESALADLRAREGSAK